MNELLGGSFFCPPTPSPTISDSTTEDETFGTRTAAITQSPASRLLLTKLLLREDEFLVNAG
jgi:hypothetical protein